MVTYKDIEWFPGYRVGDDGSVWSAWARKRKAGSWGGTVSVLGQAWKRLHTARSQGYSGVTLCRDGKKYSRLLHTLVLEAFVGKCPDGLECRHLDGVKANCALSNLKWGTAGENISDQVRHGTHRGLRSGGERHPLHKLTTDQVKAVRARWSVGESQIEIARSLGVSRATISDIVSGRTWKCAA